MAEDLSIMITAVVLAVVIMMFSAEPISMFVNRHPTVKVLALSFLLLIGVSLMGDGLGMHIPKGYIYFAMGFSVFVEMINLRVRSVTEPPVKLHQRYVNETR
jgi:predicted tellurium resistance membrane protein TerC